MTSQSNFSAFSTTLQPPFGTFHSRIYKKQQNIKTTNRGDSFS